MKAMILCAGRGERMRPLTDTTPKPLLPLSGKPLVQWTIERLARAGIVDLVVNHAHLGTLLEDALGDGRRFGVTLRYSAEGEPLETAGGIAKALPLLGDAPFLVVNGDIWCEVDYASLAGRTLADSAVAHLVLVPNPPQHPGGDFALAGGRVIDAGGERFTFSGVGIYRPALFARVAPGTKARLAPLLTNAIARGAVTGELFTGAWHDVGTPQRLAALDRTLRGAGRA